MYLRDLGKSLLRRWYLVLAALLLAALGMTFVARAFPPPYQATASVLLVPPKDSDNPDANRYLALSGLSQAQAVAIRALNSDEAHAAVSDSGTSGDYTVAADFTTSAPILVITATASSSEDARNLLTRVTEEVPITLDRLQGSLKIEKAAQISSVPLTQDLEPTALHKSQLRAVAATGILLLAGQAILIGALDGLILKRRSKREDFELRLKDKNDSGPLVGNDPDEGKGSPNTSKGAGSSTAGRQQRKPPPKKANLAVARPERTAPDPEKERLAR